MIPILAVTLAHSLWQGALIALVAAAVAARLHDGPAVARLRVYGGAMALLAVAPIVTFAVVATGPHRAPRPPVRGRRPR
ncbi:MAG: hypothetical protein ABMB14_08015 [Myxococcota bacterium]